MFERDGKKCTGIETSANVKINVKHSMQRAHMHLPCLCSLRWQRRRRPNWCMVVAIFKRYVARTQSSRMHTRTRAPVPYTLCSRMRYNTQRDAMWYREKERTVGFGTTLPLHRSLSLALFWCNGCGCRKSLRQRLKTNALPQREIREEKWMCVLSSRLMATFCFVHNLVSLWLRSVTWARTFTSELLCAFCTIVFIYYTNTKLRPEYWLRLRIE